MLTDEQHDRLKWLLEKGHNQDEPRCRRENYIEEMRCILHNIPDPVPKERLPDEVLNDAFQANRNRRFIAGKPIEQFA